MSILVPTEPPPIDRVEFKWVFTTIPKCIELYKVSVDGQEVGTMCQLEDELWRIDTCRNGKLVVGLGITADEAKVYWWENWKSHDPIPLKPI